MASTGTYSRIYAVVERIPRGRVATYGQVASLAGLAGHARQVGYALSALPEARDVPWYRVINARGELSPRSETGGDADQRDRLQAEGVVFDERGRTSLRRFRWQPREARRPSRRFRALPLTPDRWADFERLFGPRGACGGCWCMTPRLSRGAYERAKGEGNRRAMKRIVAAGDPPGMVGYIGDEPVGWCAIAPRRVYSTLSRSRILKPVDDKRVWSIVCLFVAKGQRGKGISVRLIREAVRYARGRGARIIEAYPVEPRKSPMPPVFAYTGLASAFRRAGFLEVARRSETRPIVRRVVRPARRS